ncbi:MAG: oligoribonuclease [Gammaproteobacteria bacterium AqS3]|nr:oligoribonuclease [Gammaproteobacteria bacterium AqS3]
MGDKANKNTEHLAWLDLEMTGLNPLKERIIEIAVLITDADLHIVAEGPDLVIHQDDELLDSMDEWNTETHTKSGLVQRVRESVLDERTAQDAVLDFLRAHIPRGKIPLCGNSISTDRRFLRHYMPKVDSYFHYRIVDVSTIKELAKRWRPDVIQSFSKTESNHRALEDIRATVEELRHYRSLWLT